MGSLKAGLLFSMLCVSMTDCTMKFNLKRTRKYTADLRVYCVYTAYTLCSSILCTLLQSDRATSSCLYIRFFDEGAQSKTHEVTVIRAALCLHKCCPMRLLPLLATTAPRGHCRVEEAFKMITAAGYLTFNGAFTKSSSKRSGPEHLWPEGCDGGVCA